MMVYGIDSLTLSGAGMCVGSVGFSFFILRRKSFKRLIILAASPTDLSNSRGVQYCSCTSKSNNAILAKHLPYPLPSQGVPSKTNFRR
jgi:hypothetical protein